jgi:hypothetical protein
MTDHTCLHTCTDRAIDPSENMVWITAGHDIDPVSPTNFTKHIPGANVAFELSLKDPSTSCPSIA